VHFTTVRDLETHPENFVIPLNEQIKMVCAYSDTSHSMAEDQQRFGWTMRLNSDGSTKSGRELGLPGVVSTDKMPWLTLHGWMMWAAWSFLGLV
jgi:hypothetical protein